MSQLPTVSILVLNYNSLAHLPTNLAALHALDYPPQQVEILLVDNDSRDASVAWVQAHYPQVRIVPTGANLGYAGGNNAGAQAATREWLAILNPDVRVEPTWLRELVRPLPADPTIAAVAARVLSWDGETIDFGDAAINWMGWGCQPGYRSPHVARYAQPKPLIFANGGSMLVRRRTFLEVGGFDPDYFAYYEDVDLGWRLWLHGHRVVYAPQAIAYHRHHGSWGSVADAKRWLLAERNTLFTLLKNYDDAHLARTLPAALLLTLQRAFLDVNADPALFGGAAGPETAVYDTRYYLRQAFELVRRGNVRQLAQRARDELARRRQPPANPPAAPPAYQQPVDGRFLAPPVTLARLLAGRDLQRNWDALWQKRTAVQAARHRPDAELLPLFQWGLRSNFGDPRFIHAMNHVVERFGLAALFNGAETAADADLLEMSTAVAHRLLAVMDEILTLAAADEALFRLHGPDPPPALPLPPAAVARLAEMNTLLWQLPEMELAALLAWLEKEVITS